MKKINLKTVAVLSLLTALEIVISRFLSISTANLKIGLSFLAVALAAREYGIVGGAVTGGLGDLVGALLFPIGPYFPGFTLTAALIGALYGIGFKKGTLGACIAAAVNNLVLELFLNTLWINLLYGSPYRSLLPLRAMQAAVMTVVAIPLLILLDRFVPRFYTLKK